MTESDKTAELKKAYEDILLKTKIEATEKLMAADKKAAEYHEELIRTREEKMAALKKGYAEILFNTAKEAAERVMAAEKKAAGYHQELCRTKDEALRLLVRIKQMAEAKMKEAEEKSITQQSKIDLAEAQLQEAEGIVVGLRAELSDLRNEARPSSPPSPLPFPFHDC